MANMHVETFFDPATFTFTHVVEDTVNQKCAIIDSVLDYDQFSGMVKTSSADQVIEYVKSKGLTTEWILESHIHADHITASKYLQTHLGGKTAMGVNIKKVLEIWVPIFDTAEDTQITGEQFDVLLDEGDQIQVGDLTITAWMTPGHTPACASYLVEDAIFVGDTMFAPHLGTARCDFPGGSAADLFKTIQRFYTLPDETKVYLCHDYPEEGNDPINVITIGQAKTENTQVRPESSFEEYVAKREARDATLAVPKLLFPSIQTNFRLGDFGVKSQNGLQFIKIPVNAL